MPYSVFLGFKDQSTLKLEKKELDKHITEVYRLKGHEGVQRLKWSAFLLLFMFPQVPIT